MRRIICFTTALLVSLGIGLSTAEAGYDYSYGTIINLTSGAGGLMIMVSGGIPDNCAGTSYGWLLIPESNKAITATTLLAYSAKQSVTVYTSGRPDGGYCIVNQVDPIE